MYAWLLMSHLNWGYYQGIPALAFQALWMKLLWEQDLQITTHLPQASLSLPVSLSLCLSHTHTASDTLSLTPFLLRD